MRLRPAAVLGLALAAAGCHPRYEPPSLSEPHATIKARVVYHVASGPQLSQAVLINDHAADVPNPLAIPGEVARALPVRLESTRFTVSTAFYHVAYVTRMVSETYPCGMINGISQTCTRMVARQVATRVNDGACERVAGLGPRRDGVYLMQYDYFGPDRCSLACFREEPQPDGTFRNAPCDAPPPAP
ncbi:MAG TPA: hypothetical protein VHL80_08370 [Polyangia bacterium]|nr:hypothetical protein [Polyangia bacterium]